MIHNNDIQAAQAILAAAPNSAGVNLLVVPDSIGMGDNPAITIKMQLHATSYQKQLQAPECLKYIHATLQPAWPGLVANVAINTILVKEGIAQSNNQVLKSAVIWHELGHVLHGAPESGQVYLHEVTNIFNAFGGPNSLNTVTARMPQYRMTPAADPNRAALAGFLLANWNLIL